MQASERFTDPRFFAEKPWVEYVFIFSAVMSQILTQAGTNYTLPLLKVLSNHFASTPAESPWFMSSFALATGTFILISGRLGDVFGLKRIVMIGYVWTVVWSLLSGFSYYVKDPTFFIVSRAFQGMGTAMILPNVLGATGRIYRAGTRRKHMIFSLIGLAAPVGGCSSPLFAGLIANYTVQWNWICYSYAIACAVVMAVSWWSIPHFPSESKTLSVDWIGCGLGIAGLVLFDFAWNHAPAVGWGTGYVIALLVVGIAFIVAFVWYETHFPKNPLLPRAVVRNLRILLSLLCLLLAWGSWGIGYYEIFVFLLYLRNYSPLAAGASLVPAVISGAVAALTCGYMIRWVPVHIIMVVACCVFVCGDVMLAVMKVHEIYFRQTMGVLILAVWGMDMSFPAGSILLSDSLPASLQGMAGSLVMTMVSYGQSLFLGVSSTVEQQTLLRHHGDREKSYRACMYFAIGLSSTALVSSLVLALAHYLYDKRKLKNVPAAADVEKQPDDHASDTSGTSETLTSEDEKKHDYKEDPEEVNSQMHDSREDSSAEYRPDTHMDVSEGLNEPSSPTQQYHHHYPRDVPDEVLAISGPAALV